jgi:hypothetical protein
MQGPIIRMVVLAVLLAVLRAMLAAPFPVLAITGAGMARAASATTG